MKRCLELAKKGLGSSRPNPAVGSVVVFENQIIGEGFTSPYGGSHAEVNAIQSVQNKKLLKEATLYVTLEPCSHFGKTPPCSDLIIKENIPRVVIGCVDQNPIVGGKGIDKLKSAGIEVVVGILENECKKHHKRFLTFHQKKRPYIILKWAETKDGFIAPKSKETKTPYWISNTKSRQLVHQWRAQEHGILVGANTVIDDDPSLTVREVEGSNPVRIVLDRDNSLSQKYKVFNDEARTIVVNSTKPKVIANHLYKENIQSILVEGGFKTLQAFIDSNLWDEARVFKGDSLLKSGVKAPKLTSESVSLQKIDTDLLKIYFND